MAELGSFLIYQREAKPLRGTGAVSVWLRFQDDGGLVLHRQEEDLGAQSLRGEDGQEEFLRIDPDEVPKFIAMVTGTLFYNAEEAGEDMFAQLRQACESAGIRAEFGSRT